MRKKTIILLGWILFIYLLSSDGNSYSHTQYIVSHLFDLISIPSYDIFNFLMRKLAHSFEFFILGVLFFHIFQHFEIKKIHLLLLPCLLSLNFAFFDEIHQLFVPGRNGTLKDISYDFLGILFSFVYIHYSTKRKYSWNIIKEGDSI